MSLDDTQWTAVTGTANNMTGTTAITGKAVHIFGLSKASFQAIWTGTPTGTFTVQVSNYPGNVYNDDGTIISSVTWTTLTSPAAWTALQPAGAAGNADFSLADLSQRWIRPIYTNTSGTGTLTFVYGSARE